MKHEITTTNVILDMRIQGQMGSRHFLRKRTKTAVGERPWRKLPTGRVLSLPGCPWVVVDG